MTIPLDRLYYFIKNLASKANTDHVIIYRFYPHGSKNAKDLTTLTEQDKNWELSARCPIIYCNDQEPLNYDYYNANPCVREYIPNYWTLLKQYNLVIESKNLDYVLHSVFDKSLLLHSELRSLEVEKYQSDKFIPVYYWSHAMIARDWFRYAQHENFVKHTKKIFLIYNRAWGGTREYRLKIADGLIEQNLIECCHTYCSDVDPDSGEHYSQHRFKNPQWKPKNKLENYFDSSDATGQASADFCIDDYNHTEIEVVLETLFDDSRLHLTEKSLRPIACVQPFILCATHGSLQYLRNYGFKTFSDVWDESYDETADNESRIQAILQLMKQISDWDTPTREHKLKQARKIAVYNQQRFFSKEFFDLIVSELETNLKQALVQHKTHTRYQYWYDRWKFMLSLPQIKKFLVDNKDLRHPTLSVVNKLLEICQSNQIESIKHEK